MHPCIFLQLCCATIFHHAAFPTIASKLQVRLQVLYLPERSQGSEECLHLLCCHTSELYQASNPGALDYSCCYWRCSYRYLCVFKYSTGPIG